MILLDSDILILDRRYQRDPRTVLNKQVLQQIATGQVVGGIVLHALLEVVGNLSFNTPVADIPLMPGLFLMQYNLRVIPDPGTHPGYAGCLYDELVAQLATQMSLGDAVQAVQIARYAASAQCLLTWNARHFQGKLVLPVLTPQEWLNQQMGTTGS